jgi:hypothetical protein
VEKLNKVIAGLEHCRDKDRGCEGCPYFDDTDCENQVMKDAVELLKEYRELMERNTWPCWQCEYAWMKFRRYKIMFDPDNCDLHQDKMCPGLDEEETDGTV